jgi:hypothetical protein
MNIDLKTFFDKNFDPNFVDEILTRMARSQIVA